jgi:hypothetical protein
MSAEITNDVDSLGATAGDRLPNVAPKETTSLVISADIKLPAKSN